MGGDRAAGGLSGGDGTRACALAGTGPLGSMDVDTRDVHPPLSLVIGTIGQVVLGVQWRRAGSHRTVRAYASMGISWLTRGSLAWRYAAEEHGGHMHVLDAIVPLVALGLWASTVSARTVLETSP